MKWMDGSLNYHLRTNLFLWVVLTLTQCFCDIRHKRQSSQLNRKLDQSGTLICKTAPLLLRFEGLCSLFVSLLCPFAVQRLHLSLEKYNHIHNNVSSKCIQGSNYISFKTYWIRRTHFPLGPFRHNTATVVLHSKPFILYLEWFVEQCKSLTRLNFGDRVHWTQRRAGAPQTTLCNNIYNVQLHAQQCCMD